MSRDSAGGDVELAASGCCEQEVFRGDSCYTSSGMSRFLYRAKDHALHVVEGTIEADNEIAALSQLGSQGVFPLSIVEAARASSPLLNQVSRRIASRTIAYTTRQLADLLSGGLPLFSALTLLAKQTDHPALARVIESLAGAVRDGRALSDALADYPMIFPPLYLSMVRAGELSGGLDPALTQLAELGEHDAEVRSRISAAAAYPLFVLGVAVAMVIFLLAYVIPKLSLVFLDSEQLLPLPTRLLMLISQLFTRWWWAFLAAGGILAWGLARWRATPSGRAAVDRAAMSLPGIGELVRKLDTGRFANNLGVMVRQGVPVLQALEVASRHISNTVLRSAVGRAREAVRDGLSIASALNASGHFPAFVSNMVAVGEESGTVDAALLKVASAYEREVDRTVRALTTILEPALLLLVGGVVMCIVLAMLLPVFQLGLGVQ